MSDGGNSFNANNDYGDENDQDYGSEVDILSDDAD